MPYCSALDKLKRLFEISPGKIFFVQSGVVRMRRCRGDPSGANRIIVRLNTIANHNHGRHWRVTPTVCHVPFIIAYMPKFDPQNTLTGTRHHRRSIRLKGFDYASEGAYYVTVVAWHREFLFGEIVNEEMRLNKVGKIVEWEWLELPKRFSYIELGAYMVMPNHFHGILSLPRGPKPASLGAIIAQFKSRATKRIWKIPEFKETPIWQRNYYEHIIRNEKDLQNKTDYILANPLLWDEDDENPIHADK